MAKAQGTTNSATPQIIVLTAPTAPQPPPVDQCTERVKACEQVVEAGQRYILSLNKQVEKQNDLIKQLEQDSALMKQQVEAVTPRFYEKPAFVAITTIILTAATISLVRKAAQ